MDLQKQYKKCAEFFWAAADLGVETSKAATGHFQKAAVQQFNDGWESLQKAFALGTPSEWQAYVADDVKKRQQAASQFAGKSLDIAQSFAKKAQDLAGKYEDLWTIAPAAAAKSK